MTCILLLISLAIVVAYGYWLVSRLDRYSFPRIYREPKNAGRTGDGFRN